MWPSFNENLKSVSFNKNLILSSPYPVSFVVLKFHLVRDRYSSKSHTESMARCLTPFLSVFHKAINLLPANTPIREIQVFLESVLEEKAGRKRFDQVLKSLLQAEFLRVRLLVNSFHFLLKLYSVFLRSFCQITQWLDEKSNLLLEDAILQNC